MPSTVVLWLAGGLLGFAAPITVCDCNCESKGVSCSGPVVLMCAVPCCALPLPLCGADVCCTMLCAAPPPLWC
jgi:hypothetical protein